MNNTERFAPTVTSHLEKAGCSTVDYDIAAICFVLESRIEDHPEILSDVVALWTIIESHPAVKPRRRIVS